MSEEYNKELILVHKFLSERYERFLKSSQFKSNDARKTYAHAVQTVGYIAYNCNITDKETPVTQKKKQKQEEDSPEFFNTLYDN